MCLWRVAYEWGTCQAGLPGLVKCRLERIMGGDSCGCWRLGAWCACRCVCVCMGPRLSGVLGGGASGLSRLPDALLATEKWDACVNHSTYKCCVQPAWGNNAAVKVDRFSVFQGSATFPE